MSEMSDTRMTVAQALVRFLAHQYVERDGVQSRFFAGCFGIFGHGNVAGLGQALHQERELLAYHQARNEQAMVHIAVGYARQSNRLATWACSSSVGPGATNMITGAALATINRLPVLLLPGDTFATRGPHPVLQQLEHPSDASVSVNDTFRPVSRFFDRIQRPEQLIGAALEAMRVLTDPAETGAVTLALPEDVQTEAFSVPAAFLSRRVWTVYRRPPAPEAIERALELIRAAKAPLIVAGGGVIYSEATAALSAFADATGIPVAETQAGRGALLSDHPLSLGAVGATGSAAGNALAAQADLVIGIGTRWSDFSTASKSVFPNPDVRFINVNVADFDAAKLSGLAVVSDARVALDQLRAGLADWRADADWSASATAAAGDWAREVTRLVSAPGEPVNGVGGSGPGGSDPPDPPTQAEVIGAINDAAGERGVVINAAGSAPGDLHKLWRARDPEGKGYHVEYGFSCMGYEIPAGVGVKLAAPDRDVFAIIGDGSYLMLSSELTTAVAERIDLCVVLIENHGYASIGALSRSLGSRGYGTHHRRSLDGGGPALDTQDGTAIADPEASEPIPYDLALNAESLGATVIRTRTIAEFRAAISTDRRGQGPVVIAIETDRYAGVPSYGWWDVPVAEVSTEADVQAARQVYEIDHVAQRSHLDPPAHPLTTTIGDHR
jgi:3D-(3,5/4)-trihydroxycyclohexane-1,2-dione acylhydrolase (decyclizing)